MPILAIGGRWVSPSFRGRATGLVVAGGGVGLLLAGLLVPWLLAPGDSDSWRRAWWGLAAGVLAAAAVAAIFLRDPPAALQEGEAEGARPIGPAPADTETLGPGAPSPSPTRASLPSDSLGASVYRRGAVWRLALVFGLYGVSYIVYGTFFAAHLQRHGLDAAIAGRLWSLAGLVAIGSGLLGGALADRLGPSAALVVMFALQGVGMAMLALGDGIGWFVVSAVIYGVSLWGFPPAISKGCTELVGPMLAPAALGLMATAFALGQASGPMVAGLLADATGSLAPGLLFGALTDVLGAAVAWWVRRDRPLTDL